MKFLRLCKYYFLKFKRLKGDPHSLALGTAIGIFIGISPTMPFHTIMILGLCVITRSSAIAAIISSWLICNPLTYIPIYYFSLVLGNIVTPYNLDWVRIRAFIVGITGDQSFSESLKDVADLGLEAMAVMVLGGAVLALPFTLASYFFSLRFFKNLREKKKKGTNKTALPA